MNHALGSALATAAGASLAALSDLPVIPDALIGIGVGAAIGKLLIWRLERDGDELASRRARQIEAVWIAAGLVVAVAISLIVEVP
jgi:hypothetical protein